MTNYKVNEIVKEVRIAIDQNMDGTMLSDFGDYDTLALDEIIQSKIVDGAKLIIGAAPIHMIGKGITTVEKPNVEYNKVFDNDKRYYAQVAVPNDYFRLVSFRMADWLMPVTEEEVITPTDAEYALQRSRVEGVRGCPERPVLAFVPNIESGDNDYCFEAYSCAGKSACSYTYLSNPQINKSGEISLPERLYRPIVYAIAYLATIAFNAEGQAAVLLTTAKQLANITDTIQQQPQQVQQYQPQQSEEP